MKLILSLCCFALIGLMPHLAAAECKIVNNEFELNNLEEIAKKDVDEFLKERVKQVEYTPEELEEKRQRELKDSQELINEVRRKVAAGHIESCRLASEKLQELIGKERTSNLVFVFKKPGYEYHIHAGKFIGVNKRAF